MLGTMVMVVEHREDLAIESRGYADVGPAGTFSGEPGANGGAFFDGSCAGAGRCLGCGIDGDSGGAGARGLSVSGTGS